MNPVSTGLVSTRFFAKVLVILSLLYVRHVCMYSACGQGVVVLVCLDLKSAVQKCQASAFQYETIGK